MSSQVEKKKKKDRLIINLEPEIDFLELSEILKTKIIEARAFIGSSRLAIEFRAPKWDCLCRLRW